MRKVDRETFYDFNKERNIIMVLGGYAIVNSSIGYFLINLICIITVASLYVCGVGAAIFTMAFKAKDKSVMVQAFYAMGLLFVSIGLHTVRFITNDSLNSARKLLKSGVYQYDEQLLEEYSKIKKERMRRIKFFVSFVSKGMFFCAFNYTVLIPLLQLLLVDEEVKEGELNPYLPLHLYVPFNTTTLSGYAIAYLLNAVVLFTMYTSFVCHEELYISCALQLTSELEILNYSLRNMERRAYLKLKKNAFVIEEEGLVQNLYDDVDFQNSLYFCLRENIQHHLAILRFKKSISPYVEATTSVVVLFFSFLMAAAIIIMLENTRPQLTLITDIFGFLPMCWVGQLLADESSQTKTSLFGTPWAYSNKHFKVLLKVFMSNTQQPIMLRVKGLNIKLCLETFGDMVSVGYKIMNVMR